MGNWLQQITACCGRPETGEGDGEGGPQASSLGSWALLDLWGAARAASLLEASAWCMCTTCSLSPRRSLLRCPHQAGSCHPDGSRHCLTSDRSSWPPALVYCLSLSLKLKPHKVKNLFTVDPLSLGKAEPQRTFVD